MFALPQGHNMPTLTQLRGSMTGRQRSLLTEIWNNFLSQNAWPISFEFHSPRRKAEVREAMKPLNGSIVMEVSDHQHGSRYQLTLLGVLLTESGTGLAELLTRYLEYLRERYQTRARDQTITSSDAQKDLGLDDEQTKLLGRLVVLANIYTGSAGHATNWESKDWNAGMWRDVEDLPAEGGLGVEIERLAFQRYDANAPVFLEDRKTKVGKNIAPMDSANSPADPWTVFVVHGRNEALRRSMFDFLRAIGLKPLEWSQAITATGEASPYIGQVLDTAFSIAKAVVVLMTPDDMVCLRKQLQAQHDGDHEKKLTAQARPNVLFEAGMAMGRDPKRTILVQIGALRPFSDIGGRHVLHLNDTSERRHDLADRLQNAGCQVDLSGRDWHTVGSFKVTLTDDLDAADNREFLVLEHGVYWEYRNGQKTSDGPFCQVCFDRDSKPIHLQNGDNYGGGFRWFCLGCHNGFGEGEGAGMFSSSG